MLLEIIHAANYPRVNEPCIADDDCLLDFEYCEVATVSVCKHKSLFEMLPIEYIGCVLILILLLVSNMGGLGGGGALIPVAMVCFGFDTKQAIAQSNASIFIASVARYFWNFRVTHPYKNGRGVLVDYNIASLMLPMIIVGA